MTFKQCIQSGFKKKEDKKKKKWNNRFLKLNESDKFLYKVEEIKFKFKSKAQKGNE